MIQELIHKLCWRVKRLFGKKLTVILKADNGHILFAGSPEGMTFADLAKKMPGGTFVIPEGHSLDSLISNCYSRSKIVIYWKPPTTIFMERFWDKTISKWVTLEEMSLLCDCNPLTTKSKYYKDKSRDEIEEIFQKKWANQECFRHSVWRGQFIFLPYYHGYFDKPKLSENEKLLIAHFVKDLLQKEIPVVLIMKEDHVIYSNHYGEDILIQIKENQYAIITRIYSNGRLFLSILKVRTQRYKRCKYLKRAFSERKRYPLRVAAEQSDDPKVTSFEIITPEMKSWGHPRFLYLYIGKKVYVQRKIKDTTSF